VPLNEPQRLFLDQARSDYETYRYLTRTRKNICHRLHYLQMSTEKLAKVYFWQRGSFPGFSHHVFVPFLRDLLTDQPSVHEWFGYRSQHSFDLQRNAIRELALRIQNLAPAHGNNGPNPEYPWPPANPTNSPLRHDFQEWHDWSETAAGRHLRYFVANLLSNYQDHFP
jgi:hypothetical protein